MIIAGIVCIFIAMSAMAYGQILAFIVWAAVASVLIALGISRNRQKQKQSQQQTVIVNNYTTPAPGTQETTSVKAGNVSSADVDRIRAELDAKRAEREARQAEDERRYVRLKFPVAGVTFKNEDGISRQDLLREIVLNDSGTTDVEFQEDTDHGDESGIRVMTEYGCVGFVRRSDKGKVRRFFDKMVHMRFLSVEPFETDDGQKVYRADIRITIDRDDPDEAWYFENSEGTNV